MCKGIYAFDGRDYRWHEFELDVWSVSIAGQSIGEIRGSSQRANSRTHYAVTPADRLLSESEWADWKSAIVYLIRQATH